MNGSFQFGTGSSFTTFTDGLSNTIIVGEKQVAIGKEGYGWNDCSTYDGWYFMCSSRPASRDMPLTTNPRDTRWLFGSRHTGIVQFCYADGGVRGLPDSLDPYILELLGDRQDGQVIPDF